MSVVQNEPVLSALTAIVAAGIALLVAFGVALSAPQIAAITGFVGAAYAVFALVRSKVTPDARLPEPEPVVRPLDAASVYRDEIDADSL